MSSVTDIGPATAVDAASVRRSRRGRRLLLVLVSLVALLLVGGGGASAGLYAWDASYEGRILPGVSAGGVDLSGLDRAAAVAAVSARYPYGNGTLVVATPDGDVTIPFADLGRRADADAVVDAALRAGRSGSPLERAIGQVRLALDHGSVGDAAVVLDEAALRSRIEAAAAGLRRYPTSATIAMGPEGIEITRARTGQDADAVAAIDQAVAALRDPATTGTVRVAITTTTTRPRVEDAAVFDARTQAVRMAKPVTVTTKSKKWKIKAAEVRSWLRFVPAAGGTFTVELDQSKIPANLKKAAKAVKKPAKSAQYLVAKSGKVVGVVASSVGRKIDRPATVAAIVAELEARAAGGAPNPVRVQTTALAPKLGTSEAARKAPVMSLLGSWQTWFPISERNYFGANIWVPAKLINGTVLKPGQSFDWWDAIWPVTPARGFGPGGFISSDHTEPTGALGGGMCSSSTTLFNAAMRAGLDIDARSNHKYYINRYPLGLDATVSITGGGRQTMRFRNDTKGIIFIRGSRIRSGNVGWVRYEIWGIPDGRTVSISRPSVSNVRKATTKTVYVDDLPKGTKEQIEYPSDGMTVSVSRVVKDKHGRVLHRNTWRSNYVLWNGIIHVGR
ncbi:MAG TPA: VanW family protein [Candidatus Limnocylindrales bacterium]|nr:VanW family protein [Candidatus Limnocylindrales bacterium]